jgi:hypothetical protein
MDLFLNKNQTGALKQINMEYPVQLRKTITGEQTQT